MKTFGTSAICQNSFPLSETMFAFVSLGVAFAHFFQMRKTHHLFLAIFLLAPIAFCWHNFLSFGENFPQ